MPVKYIPHFPDTVEGQAILNNFIRTRRALKYRGNDNELKERIVRGMPYYEVQKKETVGNNPNNLLIRGECVSACAYLKEKGITLDLVYIDPPFSSGADYAKKVFIRKNPKIADAIKKAEEEMNIEELKSFEEKMYGDIWNKESYLNWMYDNLMAIKSVMNESGAIYLHINQQIGHYVKILLDEVFGEENFKNEIIWHYADKFATGGNVLDKNHDVVFQYSVSEDFITNKITIKKDEPSKRALRKKIHGKTIDVLDENGKKIIVEYTDKSIDDVWSIPRTISKEDYVYRTQKPIELISRIIRASTNEFRNGKSKEPMIVADLFGGSGVTAKIAHDLKRQFIHCDVGINSIQTARDGLIEVNAEFDILDIKDGVNLFRNPVQTMDKLKTLILGLRNEDKLDKFWEGSINDSQLGTVPVYLPNLLDHSTKILDKYLMNRIINEALPNLPNNVKKVIVYYIDMDNEKEIRKFIKEQTTTDIEIELRDLKQILNDVVVDDLVQYKKGESHGVYTIEITKFISDRLRKQIDEHNQKGILQLLTKTGNRKEDEEDEEEKDKIQKKFSPIEISSDGLELIELISVDCKNKDGIWHSDKEIKIDKFGYVIEDGKKTKTFWDAKINCVKKPLRMKVRNIAGDEVEIDLDENDKSKTKQTKPKNKIVVTKAKSKEGTITVKVKSKKKAKMKLNRK